MKRAILLFIITLLMAIGLIGCAEKPIGIDAVVLVPLTQYPNEGYWRWLETGELPPGIIEAIENWEGYYLVK